MRWVKMEIVFILHRIYIMQYVSSNWEIECIVLKTFTWVVRAVSSQMRLCNQTRPSAIWAVNAKRVRALT